MLNDGHSHSDRNCHGNRYLNSDSYGHGYLHSDCYGDITRRFID